MPQADVAADFAPVRFSTADFPERERLTRWREAFGRGMARLDIEPLSSDIPFHAEAIVQALPGVRTACCTNPAARLIRTQALAADGDASIVLLFNLDEASASVAQRGKGVVFGRGDAIPRSRTRALDPDVEHEMPLHHASSRRVGKACRQCRGCGDARDPERG
jgi:hypothetical protein